MDGGPEEWRLTNGRPEEWRLTDEGPEGVEWSIVGTCCNLFSILGGRATDRWKDEVNGLTEQGRGRRHPW